MTQKGHGSGEPLYEILTMIDPQYTDIINQKFDSGFIKANGIELLEATKGHAVGRIKVTDFHLNSWKAVHGGALFSLADTIGGIAGITCIGNAVTISANINYLSPGANTEYITADASVVHSGRTTAVVDVLLTSDDGRNVAKSTLTFYKV